MSRLVIAEKPSVAYDIAKVLGAYNRCDGYTEGNGYIISWCYGHLVELEAPDAYGAKYKKWKKEDLPIIPKKWRWKVSDDKKKQFNILKSLMSRSDIQEIICATDAGREGELIFRLVYHLTGCSRPFKRLWINSMEDDAIREGFEHLKNGSDYDRLYEAALCRSKADWLVGMNGTRLFSTLYDARLSVGRVQTPTLAMVVERNKQISDFEKQKYFKVHLKKDKLECIKDRIFDKADAGRIQKMCDGSDAVVTSVIKKEKNVNPPRLYDLTTLQRESNRYYGYTAQKTLDIVQRLYEKKLITYPRTDSQYLTEDMEETSSNLVLLVQMMFDFGDFPPKKYDVHKVINNNKVSDHHAIIPTMETEKLDVSRLRKEERDILLLISQRLLCATGEPAKISETEIKVNCAGEEFCVKGQSVLEIGWKAYEKEFLNKLPGKRKRKGDESYLPDVKQGQALKNVRATITEHETSPPKSYTEDTLLSAMETAGNGEFDEDTEKKGLGTPATRSSIIEKLISSKYLERRGKQLVPTDAGIRLIDILPENVKSVKLTADWENSLMDIEKGKLQSTTFLDNINQWLCRMINEYKEITESERRKFNMNNNSKEQIGKCPRCGSPVYEGRVNYYCSNRECKFCLWKESKWLTGMRQKITKEMAKELLARGRVFVRDFYSQKKGHYFDADLVMEDTGEYVNYKLEFLN